MAASDIVIKGAREHNLRDVGLRLPRNQLICLTGVSGSGKSSLAFDTLYAEGQRRYVESLSSFARQFLGQMPKPDVDYISGLSPSISISQKSSGQNPRLDRRHDHRDLRLPARAVRAHRPGALPERAAARSPPKAREQIIERIEPLPDGTKFHWSWPRSIRRQKGEYKRPVRRSAEAGLRPRAGRRPRRVAHATTCKLDRQMRHDIEVVDRPPGRRPGPGRDWPKRSELALKLGDGNLIIATERRSGRHRSPLE